MKLTGLYFENYKVFSKRESIEVRPLTILIGRNNAGKSAITRLPLLIARALSERAESPIEVEFDGVDFGASFVDIIHNRIPHGSVGVGATFTNDDGLSTQLFLLRIRRRIAEKQLDPNQVIIYWINDDPELGERIQTIHVQNDGEVDKWPQGVFSEDFEEVRAIRKAQKDFWS